MELVHDLKQTKNQKLLRDLFIVLGASFIFALSAWISIPLFFTPVPISFTCQLILLASFSLGKRGTYATLAYLAQGAIGFPVFANGAGGIAYLMGPTGGYLIGFVIASYVVASFSEQMQEKTPLKAFGLMFIGNCLVYVFGATQLALFLGAKQALRFGLYPFIGGDFLKLLIASRFFKWTKS